MSTSREEASVSPDGLPDGLPELAEARIEEIEESLFAAIRSNRDARRVRRGRWWIGGAAAAAVVVVAAAISPMVLPLVTGGSAGSTSDQAGSAPVAPESADGGVARDGAAQEGASDDEYRHRVEWRCGDGGVELDRHSELRQRTEDRLGRRVPGSGGETERQMAVPLSQDRPVPRGRADVGPESPVRPRRDIANKSGSMLVIAVGYC